MKNWNEAELKELELAQTQYGGGARTEVDLVYQDNVDKMWTAQKNS